LVYELASLCGRQIDTDLRLRVIDKLGYVYVSCLKTTFNMLTEIPKRRLSSLL
jgi:hypothetical protein